MRTNLVHILYTTLVLTILFSCQKELHFEDNSEPLEFTSAVGTFAESPAGRWGGIHDGYAVATKSISPGSDGSFTADYGSAENNFTVIGLGLDTQSHSYHKFNYAIYVDSTGYYITIKLNNFVITPVIALVGDKFRLNRVDSVITAEYYRAGRWTVLYTYPISTTAQLYPKAHEIGGERYLLNPIGFNVR